MPTAGAGLDAPIRLVLALAAIVVVMLGVGALAWLIWLSWRAPAEHRLKPEGSCYVSYLLALALLVMAWLAPPHVVGPSGLGPTVQRKVLLVAGLMVAALGGLAHVLSAKLGWLADPRERRRWLGFLVAAAPGLALLAFIDSHYGGRVLALLLGAVASVGLVLVVLYLVALELHLRALPQNRMARLMSKARWAEAAAIGEGVPDGERHWLAGWNLAICYEKLGRTPEADGLWKRLQARTDLPEAILPHLEEKLASPRDSEPEPEPGETGEA